jgi:hypothetical protein
MVTDFGQPGLAWAETIPEESNTVPQSTSTITANFFIVPPRLNL